MTAVDSTQRSLSRLGRVVAVLLLVVAAVWFVLLPPENLPGIGTWPAALCASGALVLWWSRRAEWALLVAPALVAVLVGLQIAGDYEGWWPGTASAALGALIALATLRRLAISVVAGLATLVVVAMPAMLATGAVQTSPGVTVYRSLQLLLVYVIALMASIALRRAAAQLDRSEQQAVLRQERLLEADSDRLATARIRRVVHDTVLNTLEAIANGVTPDHWGHLRDRTRADLQALADLGGVAASPRICGLAESVSHLGLRVEVEDQWRSDPPELVAEALLEASREALLNAAKHAEAEQARVRTLVDADAAWIEVSDDGRGFAQDAPRGIGLEGAVVATMQEVGGFAIVESSPGSGTRVSLTWERARERAAAVLVKMRHHTIRFAAALATVMLLMGFVATALDTGLGERGMRVFTLLVAALVCAALLSGSYRTAPGWPLLVGALAGLALVSLVLPLGDPFCASFQYASALDPRLVILLCMAAAATTWRVYPWAAAVTISTSALASAGAMRLSPTCGWDYALSAFVASGIALAAFGFAVAMQEQRVRFDAQGQALHHALAVSSQRIARTRAQQVASPQLDAARGLLTEVAAGVHDGPALRIRARGTAQQLRQWLLLMSCTGPVPAALMASVGTSLHVVIDGDPAAVDGQDPGAAEAARRLMRWLPDGDGQVRFVVSRTGGSASVLAWSDRLPGEDDEAWRDEDGWWLHLTWEPSALPLVADR